jgi:hypothetical protein
MDSIFDLMLRFGYSNDLHDHLKGLNLDCNDYSGTSIYELVLYLILGLGILTMFNYYRGFLHRPKFTSKWIWFFHLLGVSLIVFLFGLFSTMSDLNNGNYCQDLHFNSSDCVLFALTASTYAFIWCFILSLIFKLFSVHHKRIPF